LRVRDVLTRLAALFRARRLDEDLDAEIQAHLELAERDARARGLSPEAARREARLRFGGIGQIREEHRDRRSARWLETFVKDFRYGLASLTRRRGFATVAVAVLAFGIGSTTAMFSLVDSVLLRPLPYPDPGRIVRLWEVPAPGSINQTTNGFFDAWRRGTSSFDAMAASRPSHLTVVVAGEPQRLSGIAATSGYFTVFGVHAALGRTFTADDEREGGQVIVLSHAAWRARFGGDSGVVGRMLMIDRVPVRVIGVLPEGSFDREPTRSGPNDLADFWLPLVLTPEDLQRGEHQNDVIARLRPGVTLTQAQQDVLAVHARLLDELPASQRTSSGLVEPYDLRLVGDSLRRALWLGFGAVVSVLLITCANIVNLLLASGASRRREMAVRAALGASRGRLVTQLLTESLVLCIAGGLGGVAVAAALVHAAVPFLPPDLPSYVDVTLHPRALAFASVVALGATLLVGIVPSLRASEAPAWEMQSGTRGSSAPHERLRRLIVIGEVATAMVLISAAMLLGTSLVKLERADVGARVDRIITMSADLPASDYPVPERAAQFMADAVERIRAVPSVTSASVSSDVPLTGSGGEGLTVPGWPGRVIVRFKRVDPGYFATFDIPVTAGRSIRAGDRAGATRVVVINEVLAHRLATIFGSADVIGRSVTLPALAYEPRLGSPRADFEIVGVVGNERIRRDLRQPLGTEEAAYVAIAQSPERFLKIAVRTDGDPSASWAGIRAALQRSDARVAIGDVKTMAQVKAESLSGLAAPAWLMAAFAAMALFLSALGVYGVLAHAVAQQRREIGIRLALGATPRDVHHRITIQAFAMAGIGLAVGLAGALLFSRVIRSLLFQVSPFDPSSFAWAAAVLVVVALLAAFVPALRASRVDPTVVLRSE
jgi:putative ABC transport system permease protein